MKNRKFLKKILIADGTYNAVITAFDYVDEYEMGKNTYPVFATSFEILDNGNLKNLDLIIFYSENDDSYCSEITDKFDAATGYIIERAEDLVGKYVDITVETRRSAKGFDYYVITDVAPFTGDEDDFRPVHVPSSKNNTQDITEMLEEDDDDDE